MGATLTLAGEYIGSLFAAEGAGAAAGSVATEAAMAEGTVYAAGAAETAGQVSMLEAATAGAGAGGLLAEAAKTGAGGAGAAAAAAAAAPKPPGQKQPIALPDAKSQEEARKRSIAEQAARRGRASTILTDTTNKLGG